MQLLEVMREKIGAENESRAPRGSQQKAWLIKAQSAVLPHLLCSGLLEGWFFRTFCVRKNHPSSEL